MGDLALQWLDGHADLALVDSDLASDEGLRTAVLLSLFTDRRAEPDDQLPTEDGDLRGWWGDEFAEDEGDRIGSRLWLLDRTKRTEDIIPRAEEYAREALEWLLTDRVASRVDVTAELEPRGLAISVTVHRPSGDQASFRFSHAWDRPNDTIGVTQEVPDTDEGEELHESPKDGPDEVYVPKTVQDFEEGIRPGGVHVVVPAPTDIYVCDEASGDLASAAGTADLVASGTGPLYQQSVTGWSSPFVGVDAGDSAKWGKSASLGSGESCFVLALVLLDGPNRRSWFDITNNNNQLFYDSSGAVDTEHGGENNLGSIDHSGDVHAIMWSRNATDDLSGAFTDLEPISATHDESATSGNYGLGADATQPTIRCCRIYRWVGTDADDLIAAGLANETLLTTLGWPLGAGYP